MARRDITNTCAKTVHEVEEEDVERFLGSVSEEEGDPWMVDIDINDRCVQFKIDTGSDVTVMPHSMFKEIYRGKDHPAL